jgi:hypothetical protein
MNKSHTTLKHASFESLTIAIIRKWCCFLEPEVLGHSNTSNCTTLQFAGKFITCSYLLSIFSKLLAKLYITAAFKVKGYDLIINMN